MIKKEKTKDEQKKIKCRNMQIACRRRTVKKHKSRHVGWDAKVDVENESNKYSSPHLTFVLLFYSREVS